MQFMRKIEIAKRAVKKVLKIKGWEKMTTEDIIQEALKYVFGVIPYEF